jgi:hypothetical protein
MGAVAAGLGKVQRRVTRGWRSLKSRVVPHTKVFCIGRNKTGTTSLGQALEDLGYHVADVRRGELLHACWARREFGPIVRLCRTAQAFQDVPFSWPYTYAILDYAFPGSKFVLTVRRNADEWYRSLTRFHAKLLGLDHTPTREDLQAATYLHPGAMWQMNRMLYGTPEEEPYHEATLKAEYEQHIAQVTTYFRFRDNLLVINVAEPGSYQRLCAFLGRAPVYDGFPWLNKT